MRRFAAILVAGACLLSLAACGNQKPGLDEVRQAIEEGNLTVADAVEKGYVTQEWADAYIESGAVPAGDKMAAGAIGDFTTTTLSGEEFTKDQMGDVAMFAFIDPSDPDAASFYQALVDGYEAVRESGAEIIVCAENEDHIEMFADASFPVIHYNDSLKAATEHHRDMIEDLPNSASWCVNGSFLSAWFSAVEAEDLGDDAAAFVQFWEEMAGGNSGENSGAAVMG